MKEGVLYPLPAGYVCWTGENPNVWVSGIVLYIRDLVFCPYGKQSEAFLFCLRHLLATRKV